ncbi:MAG: carboxymuconolactone decarboxylase family protein [Planctomycetes bacterium]|nr:carboxymuconolactone decarboxylase family protein [Planctomycetota bacterium]
MQQRLNFVKLTPEPLKTMYGLGAYVESCGLEPALLELVKTRASQINGCAFCLDMHTQDARAAGETEQRLYALSAWRETPFYSDRERAALAWTEAVTRLDGGVPDAVYDEARRHFSAKELTDLTWAVVVINGWNRLAISFRTVPGTYKPHMKAQMAAMVSGTPHAK